MRFLGLKDQNDDLATQGDVAAGGGGGAAPLPAGVIHMWPTATAPAGYLLCDGSTFDSTVHPDLATALGDTFGVHSGTTYYLPDFRERYPAGAGSTSALGDNEGQAETSRDVTGDHNHTTPDHSHNIPDHTHGMNSHTHTAGSYSIASVADRASGTGNRGGNPISGTSGGWSAAVNTGGVQPTNGWATGGASTGNTTTGADAPVIPRLTINYIIKT